MPKKKTHKTLLILALVLIPPFFLVFTDEGARVSDNVVLWVMGKKSVKLNLKELDAGYSVNELQTVFPELEWNCSNTKTAFGTSLCAAPIGSFNDYPSHLLTTYFVDEQLNALKILYRQRHHEAVLGHLIQQLGQPRNVADAIMESSDAASVLEWNAEAGLIVLKKELKEGDEPALLWVSNPS